MRDLEYVIRIAPAMLLIAASISMHTTAWADATVFRCEVSGVLTFSDRPCGPDAQVHEPDNTRVSTFVAPPLADPPTKLSRVSAKAARRDDAKQTESIAALQAKHKERCVRIERSLRDIRSKMRAGYDAKQGERMKDRQRKLNQERRDEKC